MIPDGVKDCVTLTGVIFDGNNNGHVTFRRTEQICAVAVSGKSEAESIRGEAPPGSGCRADPGGSRR